MIGELILIELVMGSSILFDLFKVCLAVFNMEWLIKAFADDFILL